MKKTLSVGLFLGVIGLFSPGFPDTPLIVDRFDGPVKRKGLPEGWEVKQWFGRDHEVRVEEENRNRFVCLVSHQNSFGIYKELKWNMTERPHIRWRWKVVRLPEKGDVRQKHTDDQAAQLYVVFPRFPSAINSRMVGYIWDSTAPKDGRFTSKKSSNTRYIVLQNGATLTGKWLSEERNIHEDYRELFGEDPPQPGGVTLMIDSDDTQGSAESCFDDIEIY